MPFSLRIKKAYRLQFIADRSLYDYQKEDVLTVYFTMTFSALPPDTLM